MSFEINVTIAQTPVTATVTGRNSKSTDTTVLTTTTGQSIQFCTSEANVGEKITTATATIIDKRGLAADEITVGMGTKEFMAL